jgi:hypothetical protein
MDVSTAFSRRQTLRSEQNCRTNLKVDALDYEAMTAFAVNDGVPPALAGLTKSAYKVDGWGGVRSHRRGTGSDGAVEMDDGLWVVAQSAKPPVVRRVSTPGRFGMGWQRSGSTSPSWP